MDSTHLKSYKSLVILGSTGSIGTQTLDVVRHLRGDGPRVVGLAAGSNTELLAEQCAAFRPQAVAVATEAAGHDLRADARLHGARVDAGPGALARMAREVEADLVVVATVGWTGVEPVLAAIEAGRDVALANKEVLVCAGDLVMEAARRRGVTIWPLDSEHNALHQCLAAGPAGPRAPVRRLILTCSGGPYRNSTDDEIDGAGPARTLDHPTWSMGRKITVDSATLMNKGFEVIEAHHLFGVPYEQIEVVLHPQSIVHSMVEFADASVIAQLGPTDMKLPIQYVLTQPRRLPAMARPLDLVAVSRLDFARPDTDRFPCLAMAYEAGALGGTVPCILNAANEVAVQAHLESKIPCGGIARVVRHVLDTAPRLNAAAIEDLRQADRHAREAAQQAIEQGIGGQLAASSPGV